MELRNAETQVDGLVKSYQTLVRSKITSSLIKQQQDDEAPIQSLGLEEWNVLLSLVPTNAKSESITEKSSDGQIMNVETTTTISSDEEKSEIMTLTAQQLLIKINELTANINQLEPLASKFRQRMSMKDPVTNQPRYGDKTMNRVISLLQKYDALIIAVDLVNGHNDDGEEGEEKTTGTGTTRTKALVQTLEEQCNSEEAMAKVREEEKEQSLKFLQEREEKKQVDAEQRRKQQEFEEELRLKREREELAARAEVARLQRVREEERAIQEERDRERAYLDSVPKGQDGVKAMMKRLRGSCADKKELDTALDALYTLFSQIGAHPEEIKFRRVRRDHPKFTEDIGRHDGGKEVLIAGGFSFAEVDGVKCFFSKEPDLESDMDGWSNWFDLIKATVGIIEEEMIK